MVLGKYCAIQTEASCNDNYRSTV